MSEWHWSKFFCAVRENQQWGVEQKNETLQVRLSLEPKETSTYAEMQVDCWRTEKVFGAELQRVSVWHLAKQKKPVDCRAVTRGQAQPLEMTSQWGFPAGREPRCGASAPFATQTGNSTPCGGELDVRDACTQHCWQHFSLYVLCACFGETGCSTLLHGVHGYILLACIYTDTEFVVLFDGQIQSQCNLDAAKNKNSIFSCQFLKQNF